MEWIDLGIKFLDVVIWPATVICVVCVFHTQIKDVLENLATRVSRFHGFGIKAEFERVYLSTPNDGLEDITVREVTDTDGSK